MRATPVPAMLGVVTGLQSEAAAARRALARLKGGRARIRIRCAGPGLARAEAAAAALIAEGCTRLVSFGIAGALVPGLGPGTLGLPRRVLMEGAPALATDASLGHTLSFALASAVRITHADIISTETVVATPDAKKALAGLSGAALVDMESYSVAAVALAARVPFLAIRAVADRAEQAIPSIALAGMGETGRVQPLSVMAALAREPRGLRDVLRLGRDASLATRSLSRAARLALPLLLLGR